MATIAQINANIGNAQHSTGPRTPEGKQASSRNSLRHGLYASFDALRPEDKQQVEETLEHYREQFPQPEAEAHLHELALAWFRRDRVRAMQEGFLDIQIRLTHDQLAGAHMAREHVLAGILMGDATGKRLLDKLHRWDRAYSRDVDRALKSLKALPQPEPTEPAIEPFEKTAGTKPVPTCSPIKPTLNGRCPCGSGLKYKRCCGALGRKPVIAAHVTP